VAKSAEPVLCVHRSTDTLIDDAQDTKKAGLLAGFHVKHSPAQLNGRGFGVLSVEGGMIGSAIWGC
jgi:hypothetical protein